VMPPNAANFINRHFFGRNRWLTETKNKHINLCKM
jgi:hypothetical protein